MSVKIVCAICLALLVGCVAFVLVSLISKRKDRGKIIDFIRSFKKGKCAVIYPIAIPLYVIGHLYAGSSAPDAFFTAVNKTVSLVVLRYDVGSIEGLMAADPFYAFTVYFCFTMVGLNALTFTFSIIDQWTWRQSKKLRSMLTKKDKIYLFGANENNESIYESDGKYSKMIVGNLSSDYKERLYKKNIPFYSTKNLEERLDKIFKYVKEQIVVDSKTSSKNKDRKNAKHTKKPKFFCIIINTEDEDENIRLCRRFVEPVLSLSEEEKKQMLFNLRVFVFGDPRYETIYVDLVSKSCGMLNYINKYQQIAMDFIDKYPFSAFTDERHVDYATALVKPDLKMNVFFIGFGKTNRQIFLTSVANNQFLYEGKDEPQLMKVNYHVFDKEVAKNNKNLNHNYYRYEHECNAVKAGKEDQYLPLPSSPAEVFTHHLNINDSLFYKRMRELSAEGNNTINFAIIAFGTDLENIDMAQKLIEKRKEWDVENFIIFVKTRRENKDLDFKNVEKCYAIANEKQTVYNVEKILGDKIFKMAKKRNEVYDMESSITGYVSNNGGNAPDLSDDDIAKMKEASERGWYVGKSQLERESSLYCCLSLRSKLHLMGLDYCLKTDDGDIGLTREEYLEIYAKDDMPKESKYSVNAGDGTVKSIIEYNLDFADSKRKNLAIHEHQRWNSFMISKGIVPATRAQIKDETRISADGKKVINTNGKNYTLRRHGNLTTFAGLVEFRKMIAERDNAPEVTKDVIKYDYQLLDDAFWLLDSCGFKIVKKQTLE